MWFGRRKVNTLPGHWHRRSANSASITSLAIQWRRLGAGMQRLASAVPQLQHECIGGNQQNKRFSKTSRLSPISLHFPIKTTAYGSVYNLDICLRKMWMAGATRTSARKKRTVCWRRDMRRSIPIMQGGGPTSKWPLIQTNLFAVTNLSLVLSLFQMRLACNNAGRWDQALIAARVTSGARYPRPAQLLRFLKPCKCACVKNSASVRAFVATNNPSCPQKGVLLTKEERKSTVQWTMKFHRKKHRWEALGRGLQ